MRGFIVSSCSVAASVVSAVVITAVERGIKIVHVLMCVNVSHRKRERDKERGVSRRFGLRVQHIYVHTTMRGGELGKRGETVGSSNSTEAIGRVVKIAKEVLIPVREWCSFSCRCETGTLTRELYVEVGHILRS